MNEYDYKIALVGNPNVGKTTIYNKITHSFEHVGNWHGVTVSASSKEILFEHNKILVTDVPGLYSLTIYSPEEGISRDYIYDKNENLIVDLCEVNNLSRNLYLTLQMMEAGTPLVIAITMMDELKRHGKVLNYRKLEKAIGLPVIPIDDRYHSDVHLLLSVIIDIIDSGVKSTFDLPYLSELPVEDIIKIIQPFAEKAGLESRFAAIKILERDSFILEKLNLGEEEKKKIEEIGNWQDRLAAARYSYIDKIMDGVIVSSVSLEHKEMHEHTAHDVPLNETEDESSKSEDYHKKLHDDIQRRKRLEKRGYSGLDRVLLNKYLALPMFFAVMLFIFFFTFSDYSPGWWMQEGLSYVFDDLLHASVEDAMLSAGIWSWLVSLVCDGVIDGVGGVLVFLPQIVLLFLFLALLEDSGYISRVAFMTDGLFRKIGLSGRSVFTMLMGFGCSATAVLTARGLEDDMMRKKTILLTPFMSCSARLPVYSAICGAYFALSSGVNFKALIILGMYFLGALIAISYAAIFNKIKGLKSGSLSFIMEMPPYRVPTPTRVFQLLWHNAKAFLVRVGTIVFALNVFVWMLSDFGIGQVGGNLVFGYVGDYDPGQIKSFLEYAAGAISPLFIPLGVGGGETGWQAVTALLSGLVAKEVVLASMESFGGAAAIFGSNSPAALAFIVFTLLYVPCIATITAIRKEAGVKWMLANIGLQIGTAYVVSLIFYWLGVLFVAQTAVALSIVIALVVLVPATLIIIRRLRKKNRACNSCPYCNDCNKTLCVSDQDLES
ncbi:MAG: ferrous iron transport protein B [Clostridia bacterium]|nr:ferrous iron transport protein B [Clostridia bacterium]